MSDGALSRLDEKFLWNQLHVLKAWMVAFAAQVRSAFHLALMPR
jgi:hypothetical protein